VWRFFCSVKLSIVLLLSLALTSIIGTLIPQNAGVDFYLQTYGAFRYQLFGVLGIFDMYHSWWFQGLLLLLTINIVVCSIDRLSGSWNLIFTRSPKVNPERFTRRSDARSLTDKRSVEELVGTYEPLIANRYGYCKVTRSEAGAVIYAEKGRLSRLGVYIVHLSIILLLIGGLVGSIFGFEGFVNIPEGEATDMIRVRDTGQLHRLDFQIRCDYFKLTLYKNGVPKEYRSSLSILEGGKVVKHKDIIVNDPLHYRGINIFQASYGELPPEETKQPQTPAPGPAQNYTLTFTSRASGMSYTETVKVGVPIDIPEGLGKFVIMTYEAKATFSGMNVGAALKGLLTPPGGKPTEVLLPLQFANFDKMRGGDVTIAVVSPQPGTSAVPKPAEPRYYTGLQVTNDPGVGLVYTGFFLIIAGCFITFYLSHQQLCIVIEQQRKNCRVTLAGIANRNKLAMKNTTEKLFTTMTES
jgi:cytochrome c biogenesis protein